MAISQEQRPTTVSQLQAQTPTTVSQSLTDLDGLVKRFQNVVGNLECKEQRLGQTSASSRSRSTSQASGRRGLAVVSESDEEGDDEDESANQLDLTPIEKTAQRKMQVCNLF